MPSDVLIIFVKYPRPGSVKSRLAKDIGEKSAAAIYRLCAETTLERTKSRRFKRVIFFTPSRKEKEVAKWLGNNLEFCSQKGRNLGERMSHAFQLSFEKGAGNVVAIGTDSPLLDKNVIAAAFEELKRNQCVFGPCRDGGYYLLGLSGFRKEIFRNIDWGTDKVLEQTLNAAKESKLKFSLLESGFDVDTIDGLILLKQQLQRLSKVNFRGSHFLSALNEKITEMPKYRNA